MHKTLTIRLDDETYKKIKKVAESEHRPISNFVENATLSYIKESSFADELEMMEIMSNKELMKRLERGTEEAKKRIGRMVG